MHVMQVRATLSAIVVGDCVSMSPFVRVPPHLIARSGTAKQPRKVPTAPPQPNRLGIGEFFHPSVFDKPRLYAQFEFLRIVEEAAPFVLADLAESVRPAYEELRQRVSDSELLNLRSLSLRKLARSQARKYKSSAIALQRWASRHFMNADWILDSALRTLFHWTGARLSPPLQFDRNWDSGSVQPEWNVEPICISSQGWDIANESKASFVRRINQQFRQYLTGGPNSTGYIQSNEHRAIESGWEKTPEIRKSGRGGDVLRHFEWLVQWQVLGMSSTDIAAKYKLAERPRKAVKLSDAKLRRQKAAYRTVHDGISKAAHLIDLPLRAKR